MEGGGGKTGRKQIIHFSSFSPFERLKLKCVAFSVFAAYEILSLSPFKSKKKEGNFLKKKKLV
jgi:hypothetical protein